VKAGIKAPVAPTRSHTAAWRENRPYHREGRTKTACGGPVALVERLKFDDNMGMSDQQVDYLEKLKAALAARRDWLEKSGMPKLKEEFRAFHLAVSSMYSLFVKKGYITDDPYRSDAKTDDLKIPTGVQIVEANKRDQLGQCLSNLDKELDFLVNFYQFSVDSFSQEKIKIMMGIIRYINWARLSADSDSPVTQAVSGLVVTARHAGGDPVSMTMLNEALVKLENGTGAVANHLKIISDFNREQYKYDLRVNVMGGMGQDDATIPKIKAKFTAACPGEAFYQELVEEAVREDFSAKKDALRGAVLKKLAVAGEKPKTAKPAANYKAILIEALNSIGSAGAALTEILEKLAANRDLMSNKKRGLFENIMKIIAQMTSKEADPIIYEIEYIDPGKGAPVREKLNFTSFSGDVEKKSKILAAMAARGPAQGKLEAMEEGQLAEIFHRNTKDVTIIHKTLTALDEFFKTNVDRADRGKVKGIKPELGALKNAVSRATQKFQEYNSIKEEAEQFKKLGIDVAT
jgi:hypothetical protein